MQNWSPPHWTQSYRIPREVIACLPTCTDKEVLLPVMKLDGTQLRNIPEAFRNDRRIVLAAVEQIGSALEFASARLRNDREVVRAAVGNERRAMQFASRRLRAQASCCVVQ